MQRPFESCSSCVFCFYHVPSICDLCGFVPSVRSVSESSRFFSSFCVAQMSSLGPRTMLSSFSFFLSFFQSVPRFETVSLDVWISNRLPVDSSRFFQSLYVFFFFVFSNVPLGSFQDSLGLKSI